MDMREDAMELALQRRVSAAFQLSMVSASCLAQEGAGAAPPAPPLAMILLWLVMLGWVCHVLVRRQRRSRTQLRFERRMRETAEQGLFEAHAALRALRDQHDDIREAERQRIARDIHDDLGQNLLALKIDLSMLRAGAVGAYPLLDQQLGAMVRNVDMSIRSLRSIINDLRPIALDAGLQNAFTGQLSEFTRINGIRHELDAGPGAFEADANTDAILLRILQEALSNVARHAQASKVNIVLRRDPDRLRMHVCDDGVGLPQRAPLHGRGLPGMRERAAAAGGQFDIRSQAGAGTVLSLSIPLRAPLSPAHH
jgi:signal transduction histidine kinase